MGILCYQRTQDLLAFLHPKAQPPKMIQREPCSGFSKPAAEKEQRTVPAAVGLPPVPSERLPDVYRDIGACGLCALGSARSGQVLGQGKIASRLCVVGDYCEHVPEAGTDILFGAEEDELLWKMMQAIGLGRKDVYVTNVIKCVPAAGSAPERICEQSCQSFLQREIELVQPQLILAMGEIAARAMLGTEGSVLRLRGRWHRSCFQDGSGKAIPVIVSLHPRYLLVQPAMKKAAWQDLQAVQRQLQAPS
jgi:DNA polymerase